MKTLFLAGLFAAAALPVLAQTAEDQTPMRGHRPPMMHDMSGSMPRPGMGPEGRPPFMMGRGPHGGVSGSMPRPPQMGPGPRNGGVSGSMPRPPFGNRPPMFNRGAAAPAKAE